MNITVNLKNILSHKGSL